MPGGRPPKWASPENEEFFRAAVLNAANFSEISERLGLGTSSNNNGTIKRAAEALGIDLSHLQGRHYRPRSTHFPIFIPLQPTPCAEDPRYITEGRLGGLSRNDLDEVKELCNSCPVQAECLKHALDNSIDMYVWGGLTSPERRRLLLSKVS